MTFSQMSLLSIFLSFEINGEQSNLRPSSRIGYRIANVCKIWANITMPNNDQEWSVKIYCTKCCYGKEN